MKQFDNVDSISLDAPEYFEILGGLWTGKRPPFTKAGVIRNTNFTSSGEVDYSDVAWLDVEVKQLAKRQLKPGDIIIERSGGGPKQPVGRVVQFRRSEGVFSFSNFTTAVRVKKKDELDPLFTFYVLLELYQSGRTDDIQRRTTGLRNLDFKAYKERATFPLIPTSEQRRIAHVLTTVQTAIKQQVRLIALTRELKSALMRKLFTEGLRGEKQKKTEIGSVPESWEVKQVAELIADDLRNGLYRPRKDYGSGNSQIIQLSDLYYSTRVVDLSRLDSIEIDDNQFNQYQVGNNDLIINRVSKRLEGVGKVSIVKTHAQSSRIVFESNMFRVRVKDNTVMPDYFSFFGQSGLYVKQVMEKAKKGNQTSINQGDLKSIYIAYPLSMDEQGDILEPMILLDQKIDILNRKLGLLSYLFRTVLHQVMTGQTRVNNIDLPDLS